MTSNGVQEELSVGHILRDGSVLNILFALFVYGSLAVEPEMWVNDYPPDIREKWGEKSERAKKTVSYCCHTVHRNLLWRAFVVELAA